MENPQKISQKNNRKTPEFLCYFLRNPPSGLVNPTALSTQTVATTVRIVFHGIVSTSRKRIDPMAGETAANVSYTYFTPFVNIILPILKSTRPRVAS
jgi:hypothetical protein